MFTSRPEACRGCPLDSNPRTQGFVPPVGPLTSPILLAGEAPGEEEARASIPFVGAAGSLLNRLLARNHQQRDSFRIGNQIQCRPPNNWFDDRAPWYRDALAHCRVHREPLLAEGHPVVVALGGTALKTLLNLQKAEVQDWHGTVTRDPTDRFWVVPTFHPSHLQRGAMNLFGVSSFDLQVALRVAAEGYVQETPDILVDPPVDYFAWWVEEVVQRVRQDPLCLWLAVDIETPDKIGGRDEGDLSTEDRSYQIVRVNFSVHPDEGITVPYAGPYIALCERLFALACPKIVWSSYDEPRIKAAGHTLGGDWYDCMWAWHRLQSDVPRGLGFVAPFYSRFGAWKHLASSHPGYYAACDGFQTYRVGTGIANDLLSLGMWDTFARHTHAVYQLALKPAQALGVKIDRQRLVVFIEDLAVKQRRLLHEMQGLVPDEVRPLTPKGGLKKPPEEGRVHAKGSELTVRGKPRKDAPDPIKQDLYAQVATVVARRVRTMGYTCDVCGAQDVGARHRCAGTRTVGHLTLVDVEADRYFWQEPFNPDSPDQILAYLKYRGHKPGRAKKTGADSTDRETLERLIRETHDPLYRAILDCRAVGKVRGTYGVRTLKLMDGDDRVHPVPTDRPSTGRRCVAVGTPIDVLRDVEQFPSGIPIEAVKVGEWAYTFDSHKRLRLRRIVWVGRTGTKAVVRVHWAGSNKRAQPGYLDLTPDHGVRLVSGEYKAALMLRPGDRVLSLARISDRGYIVLNATGHGQIREHRFVQRELVGKAGDHVHHRNERTKDNRAENLENQTAPRHRRRHTMGDKNPRWRHDWPELDPAVRRRRSVAEWRARRYNHRVLRVEVLPESVPVYDLEVEETHNFIANEVCVHNSYIDPNITNVITDRGGSENLAAGFRKCIVSDPEDKDYGLWVEAITRRRAPALAGSRLFEIDYSGIEGLITGWFSRSAQYIWLAKLGVHAGLASYILKRPYDPTWAVADIARYFKEIKHTEPVIYDRAKHTVHGINYGLTIYGMVRNFPQSFPTLKVAKQYTDLYATMAPALGQFQGDIRQIAYDQNYLGGAVPPVNPSNKVAQILARNPLLAVHPYGYKHWFWNVIGYRKIPYALYLKRVRQHEPVAEIGGQHFAVILGDDAKRAVAFFPQSTAAGVLTEAMLRLFDPDHPSYIGDAYYGRTPLRAPIHDSLLMEIPYRVWDRVVESSYREMLRPIPELPLDWVPEADKIRYALGDLLTIGVEGKAGTNWAEMQVLPTPTPQELGVSQDGVFFVHEEQDEEEEVSLGASVA